MENSTFLARIALEWKLIRPAQFDECLRLQEEARTRGKEILLGQLLIDRGWLKAGDVDRILKEQRTRLESSPGLSRYELRQRVGEGATAVVYHAWDRELDRPVAIKLLREDVSLDPVGRERYARFDWRGCNTDPCRYRGVEDRPWTSTSERPSESACGRSQTW